MSGTPVRPAAESEKAPTQAAEQALAEAHRAEWARLVAALARRFGDLDVAEDAAAEAFAAAVETWPRDGVPPNPGGWLTTTATRRAIDRLRREARRDAKHEATLMLHDDTPPPETGPIVDDRLRLVFTCCHPALSMEARVAVTLRLLGGLTVADIARAFLVPETTMAQRITRVLAVVFLVFNEGYLAGSGETAVRADPSDEAIRLGRLLHTLLPDDAEVAGLLALMLLTDARRDARVSRSGELVTLAEQDRGAWNRSLIAEGSALVRRSLAVLAARGAAPGRYLLLAAINVVHTEAPSAAGTDWAQVVAIYDRLLAVDPSPIVRLNRAVAVAECDGPNVALAEVDRLGEALARSRLPRHPSRPASARGAQGRGAYGVRPRDRAHHEPRRTGLSRPSPRPADLSGHVGAARVPSVRPRDRRTEPSVVRRRPPRAAAPTRAR